MLQFVMIAAQQAHIARRLAPQSIPDMMHVQMSPVLAAVHRLTMPFPRRADALTERTPVRGVQI